MVFTDEFIDRLKANPIGTASEIFGIVHQQIDPNSRSWNSDEYKVLLEAYSLAVELIELDFLPLEKRYPTITGDVESDCGKINGFLEEIRNRCLAEGSKLQVSNFRARFRNNFSASFHYEFSLGDLERIQILLNELRNSISIASPLENDHRQRLLSRLEKLQSELHKKVSDLDKFWGLVGDAGVVLGKIGTDAKPIVDRIREISEIVWRTQSRAEELPSGTKLPSLTQQEDKPNNNK